MVQTILPPRHQRPSNFDKFLFGAAYYPEHCTEEMFARDAERMANAGVNTVRMTDFAWDVLEPRAGQYDFTLYDSVIARLSDHGISTILCTPTASPPLWMTKGRDHWMRVSSDGKRMQPGSRQHVCTNNPEFRAESRKITEAMAHHFASDANVIGWQTDNEFFCHFSECYCESCLLRFRDWLKGKYGDVASLNAAWGNRFWTQTVDRFDDVKLPKAFAPTFENPTARLDYLVFISDAVTSFQREQVEILRGAKRDWWITHNGTFGHIDYWKFSEDLDFLSVDLYPGFYDEITRRWSDLSLKSEQTRAATGSFLVPEMQGGAGGQMPYLHETPPPGRMRLWAWQAVANGADGILHFRWRSCRFGAEMYWNGILDHDDVPRRRYDEFALEGKEFSRIGERLLGTSVDVRIGVLTECEQDIAYETMSQGLPSPAGQRKAIYHALMQSRLPVGFVDARDGFDGLEVIVLVGFVMIDECLATKLQAFVHDGGLLLATARTATRERTNHVSAQTAPAFLQSLFGATVYEFGKSHEGGLAWESDGKSVGKHPAYEILQPTTAQTLATWQTPAWHGSNGSLAVTSNAFGGGEAIYAGTFICEENAAWFAKLIAARCAIRPLGQAPECVELRGRRSKEGTLVFVLNHGLESATATDLPGGNDLISGVPVTGSLTLPAFGVAVIETDA